MEDKAYPGNPVVLIVLLAAYVLACGLILTVPSHALMVRLVYQAF